MPLMYPLRIFVIQLGLLCLLTLGTTQGETLDLSGIQLKQHGSADQFLSFNKLQGRVVVLDFFAYWCAPCARTSPVLEAEIQQYYEARHGNPQGIPVDLIAVNVEPSNPRRTEAFIKRAGLSTVVHDEEATLLQQFQNEGIPLIVVLDGTSLESGFIVRYQHAGFESIETLRSVIDSIGMTTNQPTGSDGDQDLSVSPALKEANPPIDHAVATSGEALLM